MSDNRNLNVESSIVIDATAAAVWDVLTNPEKVKQYLFGSNVSTDWSPGSPIIFWRDRLHPAAPKNETPIVDKGWILEIEEGRLLKFSFYSSQEGYGDLPENYSIITYTIHELNGNRHRLSYLRERIPLEFERMNQQRFMPGMMLQIKAIAEEK